MSHHTNIHNFAWSIRESFRKSISTHAMMVVMMCLFMISANATPTRGETTTKVCAEGSCTSQRSARGSGLLQIKQEKSEFIFKTTSPKPHASHHEELHPLTSHHEELHPLTSHHEELLHPGVEQARTSRSARRQHVAHKKGAATENAVATSTADSGLASFSVVQRNTSFTGDDQPEDKPTSKEGEEIPSLGDDNHASLLDDKKPEDKSEGDEQPKDTSKLIEGEGIPSLDDDNRTSLLDDGKSAPQLTSAELVRAWQKMHDDKSAPQLTSAELVRAWQKAHDDKPKDESKLKEGDKSKLKEGDKSKLKEGDKSKLKKGEELLSKKGAKEDKVAAKIEAEKEDDAKKEKEEKKDERKEWKTDAGLAGVLIFMMCGRIFSCF